MTTAKSSPTEAAAQALAVAQDRADRAFARWMSGKVKSPAYANRMARELEEAQATYDLAGGAQ